MNGVGNSVFIDRKSSAYYLNNNSTKVVRYQEEPNVPDTTKTVATAGVLQGVAMLLQKISGWFGAKLMQGKEFTSAIILKKLPNQWLIKMDCRLRLIISMQKIY